MGPSKGGKKYFIKHACPKYDNSPMTDMHMTVSNKMMEAKVIFSAEHKTFL